MFQKSTLHRREVVQIFQRESIFCSKISSGGSLFIEKLVPGGTNFGGVHFYHDRDRWINSLQPDSHAGRRESGQIPIIISSLTCQEFLGVLIDLVTNGGVQLPFYLKSVAF